MWIQGHRLLSTFSLMSLIRVFQNIKTTQYKLLYTTANMRSQFHAQTKSFIQVFHSLYKVGRNGSIGIKGFNNSKNKVTSNGAGQDARDCYWLKSPMPN